MNEFYKVLLARSTEINLQINNEAMNSREISELRVKQEGEAKNSKLPKITTSTRSQWTSHKNPRIVRVSRAFGGKDRHSKVCTVRGLRDRRIRLSVPTAIQLYDLQEKLGLSQPSKVVDWLLDASKNDIDNLPPLPPIIPAHFYDQQSPAAPNPQSSLSHFKQGIKISDNADHVVEKDHNKWIDQGNHEGFGGLVAQLSAQNLFPLGSVNQSSFPTYSPYNFHWDHPNLSLSNLGGAYPLPNQAAEDHQSLYFCPTATTIPSFPSYITPSMENMAHPNPLFSTALHLSSPMKAFGLNINSKSVHPQHTHHGRSGKDD